MASETVKDLLAKALKRQKELRLESEALQKLIDTYRKIQDLRDEDPDADQLHLWHGRSRKAVHSEQVGEMLDAARRIILHEGRPMKRGELVKLLEARGYKIIGGDKSKVFGTNVWRSGRFVHVQGLGYWPKDVDLPTGLRLV